jgi:hypothetical protein
MIAHPFRFDDWALGVKQVLQSSIPLDASSRHAYFFWDQSVRCTKTHGRFRFCWARYLHVSECSIEYVGRNYMTWRHCEIYGFTTHTPWELE